MKLIYKILCSVIGLGLISFGPLFIIPLWGWSSGLIVFSIIAGLTELVYLWLIWGTPRPLLKGYKDSLWGNSKSDIYGLKSELARKIAPINYADPYDGSKIETAISLLRKINGVKNTNIIELKTIRLIAEKELELKLNAEQFSNHIIKVLFPLSFNKNMRIAEDSRVICKKMFEAKDDINMIEEILENFQRQIVKPMINHINNRITVIAAIVIMAFINDILIVIRFLTL